MELESIERNSPNYIRPPKYGLGYVWIKDPKFLSKGFSISSSFSLPGDWKLLASAHLTRLFNKKVQVENVQGEELTLGSLYFSIQDAKTLSIVNNDINYESSGEEFATGVRVNDSITVGVSFHGRNLNTLFSTLQFVMYCHSKICSGGHRRRP